MTVVMFYYLCLKFLGRSTSAGRFIYGRGTRNLLSGRNLAETQPGLLFGIPKTEEIYVLQPYLTTLAKKNS